MRFSKLLKNDHLLRFPHPSSLQRTAKYASLLRVSGALHLALFEQPGKDDFFSSLVDLTTNPYSSFIVQNCYLRQEMSQFLGITYSDF
jgi:hypothetical protein